MVKASVWILLFLFALGYYPFTSAAEPSNSNPHKNNYQMMTHPDILIDVGHGGIDGGTSHGSIVESKINLEIAKLTYAQLTAKGLSMVLNRTGDYALSSENHWLKIPSRHIKDLSQRSSLANEIRPKLMISLHVNSAKRPNQRGPVILHQNNEQSKLLALSLQDSLNKLYGVYDKEPRHGKTYYLLKHSKVPTVIVEMGFITNAYDRQMLTEPRTQQLLAEAIEDGVIEYLLYISIFQKNNS
jgi:N-acetylmuramoyl-L-alanine amidase